MVAPSKQWKQATGGVSGRGRFPVSFLLSTCFGEPSAWTRSSLAVRKYNAHPSPPVACCCAFCSFSVGRFMCKRKHRTFTCFIVSTCRFRWSPGSLKQFCGLQHGNNIEIYFLKHVVRFTLCFLCAGKEVKVCCDVLQWYTAYCFVHTHLDRKVSTPRPWVVVRLANFNLLAPEFYI